MYRLSKDHTMKRITLPATVAASAALAVWSASLWSAHADTSTWTFTPDNIDSAELIQSPARGQLAWDIPGDFSNGTESVQGDLILRPTGGSLQQPDFQFDTPSNAAGDAMYEYGSQTGSGYFVPVEGYFPHGVQGLDLTGSAGDIMTGGSGTLLNQNETWLIGSANYTDPITGADALTKVDFPGTDVLDLGTSDSTGVWDATSMGTQGSAMYDNLPIWEWTNATFTGPNDQTLTGDVYVNPDGLSGYTEEFFANNGDMYSVTQYGFGYENTYFDPSNGGAAVDVLKTPFGDENLSWMASALAPPDYADSTSGTADLSSILSSNADILSSTFEFGQQAAASAGDVATSLLGGL